MLCDAGGTAGLTGGVECCCGNGSASCVGGRQCGCGGDGVGRAGAGAEYDWASCGRKFGRVCVALAGWIGRGCELSRCWRCNEAVGMWVS